MSSHTRRSVLIVVPDLNVGGAETHIARIFPYLDRDRFDVSVYTLLGKGALASRVEACGVPVHCSFSTDSFSSRPYWLKLLSLLVSGVRLWSFLNKEKPTIVHFFLPLAYLLGGSVSLLSVGRKRVMSRRSLNHYQDKYPFVRSIESFLHRRMDCVLGNSEAVMQDLRAEGAPAERLKILYNGIEALPKVDHTTLNSLKSDLAIENSPFVMVIVANLIPYKGHRDLIEALGSIADQLPLGWVLLCAGKDTSVIRADLESYSRQLGIQEHIRFLGLRRDVANLNRLADVGLLVSHEEGFSNSILEGMLAGLPMIVTDVGGNKEAVSDGVHGYVVPSQNPSYLAQAILRLADDEAGRQEMGRIARQRVEEHFSLETCIMNYQDTYDAVMVDS